MKTATPLRLNVLLAALLLVGGLQAQELSVQKVEDPTMPPEKRVRYVWFPRFSPDGKWLLSAHGSWYKTDGGEVRMWNAATGQIKHVLKQPRGIRSVAWSPSGTYFVSGGYGGDLRFYETATGKLLHEAKLGPVIEGVRISSDETRLVITHGSGDVRVLKLPSREQLHLFKSGHQGGVWGMALSPDGNLLATAGRDNYVRIIDLATRKRVHEMKHPGETNGVAFTLDNRRLLTGCTDSLIRVFDVATGAQTGELAAHEQGGVTDLQFSSDGKLLASAGMDGTVRLWNTADLDKPSLQQTLPKRENLVFGVAISPEAPLLAAVDWNDTVLVWDLAKGAERWSWKR
jgi:WD40 repeat protein